VSTKTPVISLKVIQKRKRSTLRWIVLLAVQALIVLHIVVWLLGKKYGWFDGKTFTPVEPSEGIDFVANGILNVGTIFFAVTLLSTVLFGRWFCGWACHVVLLQDWCYALMRKLGIRPKPFRARILMWFPLGLGLYMFVWPLFYRFVILKLPFPTVRTEFVTEEYWSSFASPIVAIPYLLICGFATVYVLGAKGFCTYGCPYGGFFAPLESIAPVRIRVNDNCQQCGKCTAACTSNVRVHEEVHLYSMVIDSGCMKIMDCVDACPNDALSIGVGPIALGKRTKKKKYDLGIAEEICIAIAFLIGFFAFRSLYAVIPMLMAVGVSLVTTWVLWKAWRLLRDDNAHFHGKQLKLHGKVSEKGILFLVFAIVVALWTVQSATVQAFHFMGDRAMATNNNDEALWYYSKASSISDGGIALASNPNIDMEVARYFDSKHQFIDSYRLYQRIDARVGQDERSTMLLGQNMQYHAQFVPIDQLYASRLKVNLHWELVWEDYVGWLKREMQFERAIQASHKAVQSNPNAKRLRIQLALLELESGNTSTAVHIAKQLVDEDKEDPAMWMLYARALDSDGRNEKAVFALEKAKQLLAERLQNR